MTINGKEASQITVTTTDGEVLAVVSDEQVVEKDETIVIIDWEQERKEVL